MGGVESPTPSQFYWVYKLMNGWAFLPPHCVAVGVSVPKCWDTVWNKSRGVTSCFPVLRIPRLKIMQIEDPGKAYFAVTSQGTPPVRITIISCWKLSWIEYAICELRVGAKTQKSSIWLCSARWRGNAAHWYGEVRLSCIHMGTVSPLINMDLHTNGDLCYWSTSNTHNAYVRHHWATIPAVSLNLVGRLSSHPTPVALFTTSDAYYAWQNCHDWVRWVNEPRHQDNLGYVWGRLQHSPRLLHRYYRDCRRMCSYFRRYIVACKDLS